MSRADMPPRAPHTDEPTNWQLIRRMLSLTWKYRRGCAKVIGLQVILLALGVSGLALVGLGVDYINFAFFSHSDAFPAAVLRAQGDYYNNLDTALQLGKPLPKPFCIHDAVPKEPRWPFSVRPPDAWKQAPMLVLAAIAAAVLAFAMIRGVLNYFNAVEIGKLINAQIVVDLRQRVYAKLQRLSFRFYDANASGSIINRVTGDVQSVRMFVDQVVVQSVILFLSLIYYAVYMLNIHVWLTVACLATTPLLWFMSTWFGRAVKPAYRENRELVDQMILALSENVQGVHVVKGFARQDEEIHRFGKANARVADQKRWIFTRVSFFQPAIGMLTQINLVVLLAYGGWLAVRFSQTPDPEQARAVGISIGQLLVFAGLLQQFSGQIANIANISNSVQQALTGARRVFEVLDAPVTITSPAVPVPIKRSRGKVAFDRVSFAYKETDPILRDVCFTVHPGQCVAVVGPTGCGKSTLLSLIPRFYDPTIGSVMIDDVDVRRYDVDALRRNIGLVFQESFLFSNTIAANIAFGHPDASREQIIAAARIAAAHDFIMEMPHGYDTVITEGGGDLSGGQRQRLAIARAVLLEPPILLLDDPTAAIDPQTEGEILEAMDRAMEGRTTFVVAHRLSTLRRADVVMVIEQGRIAQRGTHEQLMRSQGHYRFAAMLQSADSESRRLLGFKPEDAK